jgi:hypothetical protein
MNLNDLIQRTAVPEPLAEGDSTRYHIVDAASGAVTRHPASYQGYTNEEYVGLLEECGLTDITRYPSVPEEVDGSQSNLFGLLARRR